MLVYPATRVRARVFAEHEGARSARFSPRRLRRPGEIWGLREASLWGRTRSRPHRDSSFTRVCEKARNAGLDGQDYSLVGPNDGMFL